jgi:hypothetical protein
MQYRPWQAGQVSHSSTLCRQGDGPIALLPTTGAVGIVLILILWIGRLIFVASRGNIRGDPLIFAVTDQVCLLWGQQYRSCSSFAL